MKQKIFDSSSIMLYIYFMKLYLIRRQDIFDAIACNQLFCNSLVEVGSLWATVRFTVEQRRNYRFPIADFN
jgi:hypothetical protein